MDSPTRSPGPPTGTSWTPVPPAHNLVDGTFKRSVTANPLSTLPVPPQPPPRGSTHTGEQSVFAVDPVNLGECGQSSIVVSGSADSMSYHTVPVANSALRGERIMLQNSLLASSGGSLANTKDTPPRPGTAKGAMSEVTQGKAGPEAAQFPQDSSDSFNNTSPALPGGALQRSLASHSGAATSERRPSRDVVFSGQEGVAPLSQRVKDLRRQNIWLSLLLVLIALVLAVIGGVCIGVVSSHYSKIKSVNFLELKNRIVLNSSLSSLTDSSQALVSQAKQLDTFVMATAQSYSTPGAIRDDLRDEFLRAWALWLNGRDASVSMYSIKVPFCSNMTDLTTCDRGMLLTIQCEPLTSNGKSQCFFTENDDAGTLVNSYLLDQQDGPLFTVGEMISTDSYASMYGTISVNTTDGLFLVPSYVEGPDDVAYYFLKFAEQNRLPGGQIVFTETGSFLNTWFVAFQNHLQSADNSISILFTNTGAVLGYDYGPDVTHRHPPCSLAEGTVPNDGHDDTCGKGAGALVDLFVSTFVEELPHSVLQEDVINSEQYSTLLNIKRYTVAYQDFLRFRTPDDSPNIVFFAAYATPVNAGIGKEGAIQIVICVVIIVACLLIMGCITLITVMSLQRVVEMVSVVANYAATYDTDAMLRVLNKSTPRWMPNTRASIAVRQEFFRILENLTAYRSFLPPALLTAEGLASMTESVTNSQAAAEQSPQSPLQPARGENTLLVPLSAQESDNPRPLLSPQSTQVPRSDSPVDISASTSVIVHSMRSETDPVSEHSGFKAAANSRLLVSGLRAVKGTVLVVVLSNTDAGVERAARLVNAFAKATLEAAEAYNGVVDVLDATRIVVTFNCHFTTPRHAEKACKCALRIKRDLHNTSCAVTMGISTGTNYLGTIGTDRQKARVVTGECVTVAHALATLRYYLGCTIFATESAAHVSTCVSIPVDVVAAFAEGAQAWRQYVVWEILDVASLEMDPQAALAKKLFRMIRSRQGKAALAIAEAYAADASHRNEAVSWRLARLALLLKKQQTLIARGYVRCLVYWQALESTDVVPQTEAEVEGIFTAAITDTTTDEATARRLSGEAHRETEMNSNPDDETSRVRQILGEESSRISATKRRMVAMHQQRDPEDSDAALFDVYLPEPKETEECTESAPPSTSQRTTAAEPLVHHSRNDSWSPRGLPVSARSRNLQGGSGEYSVTEEAGGTPIPPLLPVELVSGAGQRFYRTDEVLGRGTYGHVFLAISQRGLFVAVKVFPVEEFNAPQLIREVETLAQLRSDYIVAYDCCGVQNGYFFICTEYLAGGSLRRLLKNLSLLPPSVVRKYARDILLGLQYLHSRNWTHCDIKPDNVLLSGDGVCKLADFGNAALARSWNEHSASIRGTARYMAPEAVLSDWKPPADVFSLGITMACMLTGQHPWHAYPERDHLFMARYAGEIRHALEKNEPCAMTPDLALTEVEPVDAELCQIVRACCSFHAADRPTVDSLLNYMT